jgi:hypothetical protein
LSIAYYFFYIVKEFIVTDFSEEDLILSDGLIIITKKFWEVRSVPNEEKKEDN